MRRTCLCPPSQRLGGDGESCLEREGGVVIVQQEDTPLARYNISTYSNIDQVKFYRPKTIPKSALSYEDILIEAAVKRTVEEHKKLMSRKEDDIVSKQLSKDLLMKAVKQSLSEE